MHWHGASLEILPTHSGKCGYLHEATHTASKKGQNNQKKRTADEPSENDCFSKDESGCRRDLEWSVALKEGQRPQWGTFPSPQSRAATSSCRDARCLTMDRIIEAIRNRRFIEVYKKQKRRAEPFCLFMVKVAWPAAAVGGVDGPPSGIPEIVVHCKTAACHRKVRGARAY
ncbi:hypothetical protein MRX96_027828 [Rhipicephalus microplus]